jgi:CBS-domain-containing membrane protein
MGTLTARDVMTRDVITLRRADTIEDAVQTLKANRITGAPVVDEGGKFVGILSLTDLVHPGGASSGQLGAEQAPVAHGEGATTWDLFEKAELLNAQIGVEKVDQRMSGKVTSVTELTPLVEVARVMCDGHWHRVPVVDDSGALHGIISTMDILAALVNTADELS